MSTTVSSATLEVIDPATEHVIGQVEDWTPAQAAAAVDRAAAAQPVWAATPPRQRAEVLRRAFQAIDAAQDEIARLIVAENGKSMADALGEVTYAAEFFRWFSEEAVRIDGSIALSPSGDKRIIVQHQPAGIALLVTPWNFPIAMATRKLAPALAAGCGAVLKPASETPMSALRVVELCREAGVPEDLVTVTPSSTPGATVQAMLEHEAVRVLSFTGSTEIGRVLLRQAAERVINCSMELGGNAPFIVCADADVERAVDGAMVAKMRNGGAACTAANRFIVHQSVAHSFTSRLAARMAGLRIGPGADPANDVGPLVNRHEQEKVNSLVAEALADGATAATGGAPIDGPGFYVAPTVLAGVRPDAAIVATEIFGPVAPIVTFADEIDAVLLANQGEHGLMAYVYTQDLARGMRLSEQIDAGMVGLNRGVVSDPAAPFGGWKQSGIGREGGHVGIHEFLETKYIATEW